MKLWWVVLLMFLTGCFWQSPAEEPVVVIEQVEQVHPLTAELPIQNRSFKLGLAGFVPRNYPGSTSTDWLDFYGEVSDISEVFGIYSIWDDGVDDRQVPESISAGVDFTQRFNVQPIFAVGYDIDLATPGYFNGSGAGFVNMSVRIAEEFEPEYLALGVEVNRLYERTPEEFSEFVRVYKLAYESIKNVSPDTKVFTIFQLEYLKGQARLAGRLHDPRWYILDEFEGYLDVAGFTVYPFIQYQSIDDIPENYLAEITEYIDVPLVITETGWPSNDAIVNGSEIVQKDYFLWMVDQVEELDAELLIWPSLHDRRAGVAGGLFDHIGLNENNGRSKLVYAYWQAVLEQ